MAFILSAFKKHKSKIFLLIILGFLSKSISLIFPIGIQLVLDTVIPDKSYDALIALAVIMLLVASLAIVLNFFQIKLQAYLSTAVIVELYCRLFRHVIRTKRSYIQKRPIAEFVQKFNELQQTQSAALAPLMASMIELPFFILAFSLSVYYSLFLSLILLAQIFLVGLVGIFFQPFIRQSLLRQLAQKERIDEGLIETLANIDTVKSTNSYSYREKVVDIAIAETSVTGLKTAQLNNFSGRLAEVTQRGFLILTIIVGAYLVLEERLTIGEFIAFNFISNQVISSGTTIISQFKVIQALQATLTRLATIVDQKTEQDIGPIDKGFGFNTKNTTAISFCNVSFKYADQDKPILNSVNFDIAANSLTIITGQSGIGKSTLVRLLTGLEHELTGTISIFGKNVAEVGVDEYRNMFASCLQPVQLFSETIHENIFFEKEKPINNLEEIAQIKSLLDHLSLRLDTKLVSQGSNLSGGQKTAVGILRTLAQYDKPIFIFDEPFTGLDDHTADHILSMILELRKTKTVIVISHDRRLNPFINNVIEVTNERTVNVTNSTKRGCV